MLGVLRGVLGEPAESARAVNITTLYAVCFIRGQSLPRGPECILALRVCHAQTSILPATGTVPLSIPLCCASSSSSREGFKRGTSVVSR